MRPSSLDLELFCKELIWASSTVEGAALSEAETITRTSNNYLQQENLIGIHIPERG
jgi:hypothetical protein